MNGTVVSVLPGGGRHRYLMRSIHLERRIEKLSGAPGDVVKIGSRPVPKDGRLRRYRTMGYCLKSTAHDMKCAVAVPASRAPWRR